MNLPGLSWFDVAAVLWFFVLTGGYSYITTSGPLSGKGLVQGTNARRLDWMSTMMNRDNRIVDVQLLATMARGNGFFASTSVLVTGALAALFGTVEELQQLAMKFPLLRQTTVIMWQLKVLFMMGIFVYAFFKFAWSFRLAHYAGIMIGATPLASDKPSDACKDLVGRTATLIGLVGLHANAGLRAYYYGMAALGWFIHPSLFMILMLWVIGVLYRREYHSRALRTIVGDADKTAR